MKLILITTHRRPIKSCHPYPNGSINCPNKNISIQSRSQWLTPVILATQEAEIRRIMVQRQPGKIVHKTLSQKGPSQKVGGTGGVAQGVGPEFKPQYHTHTHKSVFYIRFKQDSECYQIIFKISRIKFKSTLHIKKKQENQS
jgi:hypothetical protein